MCGIAGFCNMPERWQENITKMNDRMIHRGPDEGGMWANVDSSVVFGHRRLSIRDLSPTGSQPMSSASGRFVIVLNGEIYNYGEIAKHLAREKKAASFRGTSDTEVLLEAFEAYGIETTLKMIKGMFAVALYDQKEKKLYLMRDRIGEKPLYYGFLNDKFIFASDITAIRANIHFTEELDFDALSLYFGHGYIPAPYTIYKNIRKLEPGSVLELEPPYNQFQISRYWDIMEVAKEGQNNLFQGSEQEAADQLEKLIKDSISGQMAADVPVGAFLSGGIDSTTVAAVMQSLNKNKIKTFTIGFEQDSYNEAQYAKESAKYLGTDHVELYITDKEAQAVIPKLAGIYGEPFADSSQIPTYLVSRLARESVTVSLSGDGGDELFCGYGIYNQISDRWNTISKIPYPLRKGLGQMAGNPLFLKNQRIKQICQAMTAESGEQLYEFAACCKWRREKIVKNGDFPNYSLDTYPSGHLKGLRNNIMLMDLQMYHPDDILVKVDRAGMAVSLESRVPFLDKDIVEFAWTLPIEYKNTDGSGKKVLKNVLYRYIPMEMMDRPKKGFSIPIHEWIRSGELRQWAESLISEANLKNQGILDEKIVCKIWDNFINRGIWCNQIWYILMFQEWLNHVRAM